MTEPSLFPIAPDGAGSMAARLEQPEVLLAPGCFDGLSARLLEAAGHESLFLSGFSMAAARLGLPDVGLMSFAESLDQLRSVRSATSLPVIADADTGYGNPVNAARTFLAMAGAGAQCVMIEDQAWPKRCGHTSGKEVVDRAEAVERVRACARVRAEHGLDALIMARTDAAAAVGFDEAMRRCEAFVEAGADITFLEAPESAEQLASYCRETPGHKTVNLVEDGRTPWLTPRELSAIGCSVALYPVSMLLASTEAMQQRAALLRSGGDDRDTRVAFDEVRATVGWPAYEAAAAEHSTD